MRVGWFSATPTLNRSPQGGGRWMRLSRLPSREKVDAAKRRTDEGVQPNCHVRDTPHPALRATLSRKGRGKYQSNHPFALQLAKLRIGRPRVGAGKQAAR